MLSSFEVSAVFILGCEIFSWRRSKKLDSPFVGYKRFVNDANLTQGCAYFAANSKLIWIQFLDTDVKLTIRSWSTAGWLKSPTWLVKLRSAVTNESVLSVCGGKGYVHYACAKSSFKMESECEGLCIRRRLKTKQRVTFSLPWLAVVRCRYYGLSQLSWQFRVPELYFFALRLSNYIKNA